MLPQFGCVTGEKMSQLRPGMTKAEVVSVLGGPDGYKRVGDFEVYRYSNRLDRGAADFKRAATSGWSWDKADYNVVFKNDRVVEYGTGQVRQQSNGTVVIVPVRS
jgi:outer membrane protein assembly factor BamE (lipoprotein component of BamABCDE complex)